jgi:malic enzyme
MKNSEMGMKLQQRSTHIPMGMKVQQRSTFRFFFTTSKNINIIRNEIPILELVQQMGAIMLSESYTTTVGTVCLKIIDGSGKKYWRYPQVLYIARTVRQK